LNVEPTTHIDSEYSRAGIMDPKIILTTSRDPSSKLLQFAKVRRVITAIPPFFFLVHSHLSKEMRLVFPNSYRINRGNYVVKDLAEACRANDVTDLIVLHEHRGTPGACFPALHAYRHQLSSSPPRCHDRLPLSPWTHSLLHAP
jgi:U3 small nucleolar ribonucleoprotein protein IMP4